MDYAHPLDPATAAEIRLATDLVKKAFAEPLRFKVAGLDEPPKKELVAYLDAEHKGLPLPPLPRRIFVMWYVQGTPRLFEGVVDVTNGAIIHQQEMPPDFHSPVDRLELDDACKIILDDPVFAKELQRLGLSTADVVLEPWSYGVDGTQTSVRKTQVFLYRRNPKNSDPDSSHYSFPLDIAVVFNLDAMQIDKITRIPAGTDSSVKQDGASSLYDVDPVEPEYMHHLQKEPPRTTMKPYNVVQPEGPSFSVKGHLIEWEKWRFRVGFNWREGLTIHDVYFMGRSTFYRLSLSEMFVPYGDPRGPYDRKAAFDLGNMGAGVTANNLQLGCDCLGLIKYLDGYVVFPDGSPAPRPNAICIHEVDNGIQWKHTNFRTGRAVVVRKRQLVVQQIITVANYEYIFAWIFDQSGEITFETRATGIVSTQPLDVAANASPTPPLPWGTRVADGVFAPYHQHLFSVRIDPAIDGHVNSLVCADTVPLPWDETHNAHGVGFVVREETVQCAGALQDDVALGRTYKIVNTNVQNCVSRTPVAYKLLPVRSQLLMAQPGSWHAKRSEFAEAPLWVTRHKDRQLFSAGDYTNQSLGGTGIQAWVRDRDPVANTDLVLWHSFGFTHKPRTEDFPIMPAEIAQMHLTPFNFYEFNPTNDVPPSRQEFNKSTLYEECCKSA